MREDRWDSLGLGPYWQEHPGCPDMGPQHAANGDALASRSGFDSQGSDDCARDELHDIDRAVEDRVRIHDEHVHTRSFSFFAAVVRRTPCRRSVR